jgi:hypothetical protein
MDKYKMAFDTVAAYEDDENLTHLWLMSKSSTTPIVHNKGLVIIK